MNFIVKFILFGLFCETSWWIFFRQTVVSWAFSPLYFFLFYFFANTKYPRESHLGKDEKDKFDFQQCGPTWWLFYSVEFWFLLPFLCDSVFFLYCFIDKRRFSRIHLTWRFVFWVFSPLLRYLSQKKKKQISLHSHYSEKFPHSAMTLRQEFFIQFIPYVKLFDL